MTEGQRVYVDPPPIQSNSLRQSLMINLRRIWFNKMTLHLQWPLGQTLVLALIIFAMLMSSAEVISRSQIFKSHFIANDWTSSHNQFEVQLGRLENIVAMEGPVDCLFLGNSMVWHGFDPAAFSDAYQQKTGQSLRCFNFGVDGMPTASAGALARILVHDYRPKLLLYGTDSRDYAIAINASDATVLLDSPWLRYRLNHFSITGWLWGNFHFLRYRQTLGYFLRLEKSYLFVKGASALNNDNYGFYGVEKVASFVNTSPSDHTDLEHVRYYSGLLSEYQMLPENLNGLQEILNLANEGTDVVIVEMPVPETYLDFFGNGEQDYQRFLTQVADITHAGRIPFWTTTSLDLIPDNGWFDYSHLNILGAKAFSHWLGNQVGETADQGLFANLAQ
jgi:hypothetical protein